MREARDRNIKKNNIFKNSLKHLFAESYLNAIRWIEN